MKVTRHSSAIICVFCVVAFCAVSISGKIFTLGELPEIFMRVFLGAIVTSIITLVLLNGQSAAQEVKERNAKVFERKSLLYEHYIKMLNQIIENQPIKIKDFIDVKSEFYSNLVLYLDNKFQKDITDCIAVCIMI